jgi:ribonuclease G
MKGRTILIEPLPGGGDAAALMVDGRLEDLLIDPKPDEMTPRPEAIYLAAAARPMKGLGGCIVDLGGGLTGFLRGTDAPPSGKRVPVQVSTWAEPGKAPPVSTKLLFKGRTAIVTPQAPGINIARGLRDPDRRAALKSLALEAMGNAPTGCGLILRSASAEAEDQTIRAGIVALLEACRSVLNAARSDAPFRLRAAPNAAVEALREWNAPTCETGPEALADHGVWEDIAELRQPVVRLGAGWLAIEPTRALTAVDVNTGGDLSSAAGLKINLAAVRELPRQLRLRGLGGQIVIDFAPLAKPARVQVERALNTALRTDATETRIVGWTPLGHLELQRKRSRRPLGR